MKLFLVLFLMGLNAMACLNLTGKLSGGCVYSSPTYGDLDGSIDFDIVQNSCNEISFDGQKMSIPGNMEQTSNDQDTVDHVRLAVSWRDNQQSTLNFEYDRHIQTKGKETDSVSLKGFFQQKGNGFYLEQVGTVDGDPVKIKCDLYK